MEILIAEALAERCGWAAIANKPEGGPVHLRPRHALQRRQRSAGADLRPSAELLENLLEIWKRNQ